MEIEEKTIAEMTASQLKNLIQSAVKKALREVLEDPDADRELMPAFEERFRQATAYVASGGHLPTVEELTDPT